MNKLISPKTIALAGNPNVGKSTVFNALTGLRQHTGNWAGKTVAAAVGYCGLGLDSFTVVDLPGTYSLLPHSAEEVVARDYICGGEADLIVVVCDATCLERNLNLVLQTLEITRDVLVCVNLLDEATAKGIALDLPLLEEMLGVPVVGVAARKGAGLPLLLKKIAASCPTPAQKSVCNRAASCFCEMSEVESDDYIAAVYARAEEIAASVVSAAPESDHFDRRIDRVLMHPIWGKPVMLALLAIVLWLTITGSNYPSQLLSTALFALGDELHELFAFWQAPLWLSGALIDGIYRVLAWVVSVMLPPMAIFFPLFTLLEDFGYLPRVAFNLDNSFRKAGACGKQSLTMCMGFGCNAAGVVGCRIIDSPRERLVAILTNNLVPCNGRFPTLITLITIFFIGIGKASVGASLLAALALTGLILLGIVATLLLSKLLSKTLLKGVPSSFTLELPPYRSPQIGKVIIRSIFERTLFVLGRAAAIAAPAGLLIWLLANIAPDGVSLLAHAAGFLDPFAKIMGLDGVILLAFVLGFPANEIIMPIIIMAYLSAGAILDMGSLSELKTLLLANGWTAATALCTMLFSLFHFPCSTTCLTIKKETGSLKWTAVAFLMPTVLGVLLCSAVNFIIGLF